jgi:cobalt-zinc-cadmium efflux system protein
MPHEHEHNHEHKHNHSHGHSHSHNHAGEGNISVAFFLNLSFTVIELIGGILTNSVAIISDAVHDFGDSLSLGLAWYFARLSKKGSNKAYTYGYKRFSLLGAIINSVVLVVGSVYILTEAVPRIFAPQETNVNGMMLLAVIGILINGAAVLRTKKATSINERVVSLHLLEDVLGWVAVLIGSIIMRFTGWTIIDPILSVVIAAFVLFNVFRNIKEVLPILLQGTPADIDREHIIEELEELAGVQGVHDLHIWSLDEEYKVLTVHVSLAAPLSADELATLKEHIRAHLTEEGIQHATIEIEAPDEVCGLVNCI